MKTDLSHYHHHDDTVYTADTRPRRPLLFAIALPALAVLLLGVMASYGQERLRMQALPIGTVTNITTNITVNASGTNYTYATNALCQYSPPLVTNGVTYACYFGGNQAQSVGHPETAIANGWVLLPQNVDLAFDPVLWQPGAAASGTVGLGYDFSDDGVWGTTNTPLWINYTVGAANTTNQYSGYVSRTNLLLGHQYIRWTAVTSSPTCGVMIFTNRISGVW